MKSAGKLSQDKVDYLEAIPGWLWNVPDEQWNTGFAWLQTYTNDPSNVGMPQKDDTIGGFKIGFWVMTQRVKKAKNTLSQDRIERLESIPGWCFVGVRGNFFGRKLTSNHLITVNSQWDAAFDRFEVYVGRYGNTDIPFKFVAADGFKLGGWCYSQRTMKGTGKLSAYRENRLNSVIGWYWNAADKHWKKSLSKLKSYVDQHGSADMPQSCVTVDRFSVGIWCRAQRDAKLAGKLSAYQIEVLASIPGWYWGAADKPWEAADDQWKKLFLRLQVHVDAHGSASIPHRFVTDDGVRLGAWCGSQRTIKSKNELPQRRIDRLESLSGWTWTVNDERWNRALKHLQSHVDTRGDTTPPYRRTTVDGVNIDLDRWINDQRMLKSKDKLSQERIDRLDGIVGWTWIMTK